MMNTQTDKTEIDGLIAGYFAKGLTKEELSKLHDWLKASIENKAYFMQLQEIWFSTIGANNEFRFDKEQAFQRFLARTAFSEKETIHKSKHVFFKYFRQIAAAAILLIFSIGGYWIVSNKMIQEFADVSIEAPSGSMSKLHLPDGSLVWLKPCSKIVYSQGFGIKDRRVELEGEAFFEVTKNKHLPFSVKSNNITVSVLGTKFNFKNYNDEGDAKVTLLEGRISLVNSLANNSELILAPNEQAVYNKKTQKVEVSVVNANHISQWRQGILFFDEQHLSEITNELERIYDVRINIADYSLKNTRFYGSFKSNEQTIQEVLEVLATTNKLKYEIHNKDITLSLR